MTKKQLQNASVKLKKIVAGLLFGTLIGLGLESISLFRACRDLSMRFLLHLPTGTITGAGALTGAFIAAAIMAAKSRRLTIEKLALGHLPNCADEFITLVIGKMRYRKKVQADVAAELTAHFEDELRSCKNSEEKEQKAKKLIEDFGDTKLLAVLLRRAKKRCRPLWQSIVARILQTAVFIILSFILYTAWFFTGKPNVSVDYLAQINEMNKPHINEADNAWPEYQKAMEFFVEPDKILKKSDAFKNFRETKYSSFANLPENDRNEIKKWLEQNEAAWQQFISAGKKPYFYKESKYRPEDQERWLWSVLTDIDGLRNFAEIGIWRCRVHVADGNIQQALDDCLEAAQPARYLRQQTWSATEQLFGIGLTRTAAQEVLHILATENLSQPQMEELQQKLLAIYPNGHPNVKLQGGKVIFMDVVQHVFTDGGFGGGHLIPKRWYLFNQRLRNVHEPKFEGTEIVHSALACIVHARRDQTLRKASEIFDKAVEIADMAPYQRHLQKLSSEDIISSLPRHKYGLICILPSYADKASDSAYRGKALYEATIAVLAALRYKKGSGQYAAELQEVIAAGYLKKMPMDPWSDKPLVYKKTEDGFTLYSVGLNFNDDGGKLEKNDEGEPMIWGDKADAVFWPVPKTDRDNTD